MIRKILTLISDLDTTKALLGLRFEGYLYDLGWFNAFKKKMPVGQKMEPLPWVTYPFIDFITPRLNPNLDIFEYGAGNSTLYYAKKVKTVTSVEHDKDWFASLKANVPANAKLLYEALEYNGLYAAVALNTGRKYDIIIVDGRDRVNCAKKSLDALKENGVLILDDSERTDYTEVGKYYKNKNFRQIDFWGIAPGLGYKKCTTIYYRDQNCLGI